MRPIRASWLSDGRLRKRISGRSDRCRSDGQLTHTDTWAGRGGFGSQLLQRHNMCAIIFGGTFTDEDFRDRKVADEWFVDKYEKKLKAVDFEATTKYRFDPGFETGGTLGVNYAKVGGRILYFNYRSIFATEEERRESTSSSSSSTT